MEISMNRKSLMRCSQVGCLVWACGIACVWRPAFASYMAPEDAPAMGLYVLDTSSSQALNLSGSASIVTDGVYVNSSSSTAIKTSGTALVTARNIMVVGNASFGSSPGYAGVLAASSSPCADPCAGTSMPSSAGMTDRGAVSVSSGSQTIQPGYYSGAVKVSGGATLNLAPGVYILGAGLTVSSSTLTGEGVSIVVLGGGVTMSGGSPISLNTSTTAPLNSMTIAQPASNTNKMSLSGGSEFTLGGIIWCPGAKADLSGSSSASGVGPAMGQSFVAKTVNLSGSSTIRIGRTSAPVPVPSAASLMD
jgi:hypothetical protein